jgi:hypothetical protein
MAHRARLKSIVADRRRFTAKSPQFKNGRLIDFLGTIAP